MSNKNHHKHLDSLPVLGSVRVSHIYSFLYCVCVLCLDCLFFLIGPSVFSGIFMLLPLRWIFVGLA